MKNPKTPKKKGKKTTRVVKNTRAVRLDLIKMKKMKVILLDDAGSFNRGKSNVQCGISRTNLLVAQCQHFQRPKMGERSRDSRRGPSAFQQVRCWLRPRPAAAG